MSSLFLMKLCVFFIFQKTIEKVFKRYLEQYATVYNTVSSFASMHVCVSIEHVW